MNRDLQKHKQSDCIKWIAVFLAVILLATGVAAALTQGFKEANPYCWFGHDYDESGKCVRCGKEKPVDEEKEVADTSGMVTDTVYAGNGIMLTGRRILRDDYDQYGIMPIAESAQQLTATIQPSSATYKAVQWTIAWKNASSSWATGKTVTDYVTVTPVEEGGLVANVQCLQPFGEQIAIKCISLDDSSKFATATVDYRKRVTGATVSLQAGSSNAITLGNNANTVSATITAGTAYTVKVNVTESVGSLASGYKVTHSLGGFVENFFSVIGTSGSEMSPNDQIDQFKSSSTKVVSSLNLSRSEIMSWLHFSDWAQEFEHEDEYTDRVMSAMAKVGTSKNLGRWYLKITDAGGTQLFEGTFYFAINLGSLRTAVSGVTFSGNSSLVF